MPQEQLMPNETVVKPGAARPFALNRASRIFVRQYGGILAGLLAVIIIFALLSPKFLSVNNMTNILLQVSITAIAAFGMTYVLLLGDVDLSAGSMLALVGTVSALLVNNGIPMLVVLPLALLVGVLLGATNGFLSAVFGLPAFVVTLATLGIYRGIAYILTGGIPISVSDDSFLAIGNGDFFGVPNPILILVVLLVLNHFVLSKTVFGRRIYFSGGNREAALYSGINVVKLKILVFIVMGIMAGVSGLITVSRLYSAQPNAGIGTELDAIAAAVLGGTGLSGGYGTILGTLVGALTIGVINNGMNLLSVPYFYQLIVKGMVILVAVYMDVLNKKRRT
jgi:ribose transport system permease protein